jgi:hypothetical protein
VNLLSEIKKLQGKTLHTLDRKKPFEINEVLNNAVIVRTSSGEDRSIPLKELEHTWAHLERRKKITRTEIRELGYSNFHPAYVASILTSMPGVAHFDKPITLSLES